MVDEKAFDKVLDGLICEKIRNQVRKFEKFMEYDSNRG